MTMLQLKVNGGNGRGRPNERELTAALAGWLTDLDAAESLRKQQLREIALLRKEVYRVAAAKGVPAKVVRAAYRLTRPKAVTP
jgi:hypothetical protein